MPSIVQNPPLVGRESETGFLQDRLAETFAGKGSVILIAGEAGIGKSRLAEEFGRASAKRGARVVVGRCVPGTRSPYLPFRDAFEHYREAKSAERSGMTKRTVETARNDPQESTDVQEAAGRELGIFGWIRGPSSLQREQRAVELDPVSESERTLHSTREFLCKLSAKQPILLVLEDLQWADSASVQLLHFLARNSEGLRVLLVGTYRPEDLTDEIERVHPFLEGVRIMRREGILDELALDRLNADELRLAVEGMLDGKIDSDLLAQIASESGGNPLFAVEVVRLLVQTKSIDAIEGAWRAVGRLHVSIPSTIREVILRRIDRLSREERQILESASVMGELFDPSILEKVLGLSKLKLLETLDSVGRRFQLVRAVDHLYRFSHDKVRQTAYEEISSPRRSELHRQIAHILEGQTPGEDIYGQLSAHFYYSGDTGKCIRYSVLAGRSSLKMAAAREALDYFQRTLEIAAKNPSYLEQTMQALEGAGDANRAVGLYGPAIGLYGQFLERSTNPTDRVRVLRKSAEINYPSKVSGLLDEAEGTKGISAVEIGRIKRARGHLAFSSGSFDEAETFFSAAEELYLQEGATEDRAFVSLDQAALNLARGYPSEALGKVRRAELLLSDSQTPGRQLAILKQLGDVYWTLGLVDEALKSYGAVIEIAEKFGRYPSLIIPHIYRGGVYLTTDDVDSAERDALKARRYAERSESLYDRAISTLFLSWCKIRQGKVADGEQLLQEGTKIVDSMAVDRTLGIVAGADPFYSDPAARFYSVPFIPGFVSIVHAELLACKGIWATSDEEFRKSNEFLKGSVHSVLFRAFVATFFALALLKQGRHREAKEQLSKAAQLYEKLENKTMLQRVVAALATLG